MLYTVLLFYGFFHGVDTIFILWDSGAFGGCNTAACLSRLDWSQTKTNEFSGRKQICIASTTQSTIPTVRIIFFHIPYLKKKAEKIAFQIHFDNSKRKTPCKSRKTCVQLCFNF